MFRAALIPVPRCKFITEVDMKAFVWATVTRFDAGKYDKQSSEDESNLIRIGKRRVRQI
jgi:hypothetical protein